MYEPRGRQTRVRGSLAPVFVGSMIAIVIIIAGVMIPSPYIIEKPGPVVNTLGEMRIDGESQPIITLNGQAPRSESVLNLLTVSVVGSPDNRLGWLELLPALIDHRQSIVRLDTVYRPGETADDRSEANQAMMQNSQQTAIVSALHELGINFDTTVTVTEVVEGSAADGVVRAGDEIRSVNGQPVVSMAEVRDSVSSTQPGHDLSLTVVRDGQERELSLTPQYLEPEGRSVIGVVMSAQYEYAEQINFDVDRIGGPSAGMVFSLAVIELLSPNTLIGDAIVSGTGTIDDGGNVGPIGGLEQKMWAAASAETDLFLMPVGNCEDLPADLPGSLAIVAVDTLEQAVTAIGEVRRGEDTAGLSRCVGDDAQVAPVG